MPWKLLAAVALIWYSITRRPGDKKGPRVGTVKFIDGIKYKWAQDLEHKGRYTWVPASQLKRKKRKK